MYRLVLGIIGLIACGAHTAWGQLETFTTGSTSCTFEGESYTDGAIICQGGTQQKCVQGTWAELNTPCRNEPYFDSGGGVIEPHGRTLLPVAPIKPTEPLR